MIMGDWVEEGQVLARLEVGIFGKSAGNGQRLDLVKNGTGT